jgi:restriction system protein
LLATDPKAINVELLLKYPAFKDFYLHSSGTGSTDVTKEKAVASPNLPASVTPEEQIEAAYSAVQADLSTRLLERILQNSPSFFERLIVDLLIAMGYGGSYRNATEQLGRVGDGGVDGVINEDRLGLDRVYVQAKRYAPGISVGRPEVQAFVGSLVGRGASKGVFVTTSSFSSQAVEYAKGLPQRVILIDGQSLTDLMIEHNVGARVSRTIDFKRIDEDFFSEED